MASSATRLDRVLVTLLGLLLLAAGVLTLVRSFDGFGSDLADDALISGAEERFVDRNGWFWYAVAAGGVVLALLALRWLVAQLRSDRAGVMDLEGDTGRGRTTLHPAAVTTALVQEIEGYRGVRSARARLLHDPRHPDLVLAVDVDARADLPALRERIETDAVSHARQALELDRLPTRLTLRPARP